MLVDEYQENAHDPDHDLQHLDIPTGDCDHVVHMHLLVTYVNAARHLIEAQGVKPTQTNVGVVFVQWDTCTGNAQQ